MTNTNTTTPPQYPANWRIAADYDPNDHMLNLKGKDYLTVQNRLLWFVRDQRDFIVRGLAAMPYIIRSEVVELDVERGYAHFRTYVRDVLGNEATMYGSETAKDFGDYAEKASTKSLGRALAMLGYGTAAAPEMDEGERVVDTPVERRKETKPAAQPPQSAPAKPAPPAPMDDSMSLTHASAMDQKRLYGQLAARRLHENGGFLRNVTGRDVDVERVRDGRSDLSVDELNRVMERLTRMPVNGKAAAR